VNADVALAARLAGALRLAEWGESVQLPRRFDRVQPARH